MTAWWLPVVGAQTGLIGTLMILAFCAITGWMLAGTVTPVTAPDSVHGRHRAGRPHLAAVPDLEVDDVLPFVPGPDYSDEPDDWTADLPTAQLAVVTDAPRRTSPTETVRAGWPPIFAQLAADWGYDARSGNFHTGRCAA